MIKCTQYTVAPPNVAALEQRVLELERENALLREALRRPVVIYEPVRQPTPSPWYSPYTPVWDGFPVITWGDTYVGTTTSSKLTKE